MREFFVNFSMDMAQHTCKGLGNNVRSTYSFDETSIYHGFSIMAGVLTDRIKLNIVMDLGQNINLIKSTHYDGRSHIETG